MMAQALCSDGLGESSGAGRALFWRVLHWGLSGDAQPSPSVALLKINAWNCADSRSSPPAYCTLTIVGVAAFSLSLGGQIRT